MTAPRDPGSPNPLDDAARRVDNAVERAGLLEPSAQRVALALKAAVEEFHREGLRTIVARLKDDPDGRRLLFELVGVEPPVVRVRLSGACQGCSQSSATLREVVEQALVVAVPGVQRVEVVAAEPAPALVPLGEVRLRPGAGPATAALPGAGPATAALPGAGSAPGAGRPAVEQEVRPFGERAVQVAGAGD